MSNIIDSIQLSGTVYTISGGSGGNYSAGRGIDITNDTISVSLPISAGTGNNSTMENTAFQSAGYASHAEGNYTNAFGNNSHAEGRQTQAIGSYSHAEGGFTNANNQSEHASGQFNVSNSASATFGDSGNTLFSVGNGTDDNTRHNAFEIMQNGDIYLTLDGQDVKLQDHLGGGGGGNATVELTQAEYDALVSAGTVSANTYYIITDAQSPDITQYWTSAQTQSAITEATSGKASQSDLETVSGAVAGKQDQLISGTNIKTINNESILGSGNIDIQGGGVDVVQTTGDSTTDVMSQDAVTTQLGRFVTVAGDQTISGRKVFTYSAGSSKAIEFKQTNDSAKVGFRIINSAETNNEVASFEFRPNTFTIDGVQHPLMYFGHYRNTNTAAGVPQTVIGFRQYDQKNAAAYHYLMPLPEKAKTPFSLKTSFKDYYAPMGFKNGSTMITADNTGVVDLSSELDGLKLKKLTQAQYDALATKDSNTLYVIVN